MSSNILYHELQLSFKIQRVVNRKGYYLLYLNTSEGTPEHMDLTRQWNEMQNKCEMPFVIVRRNVPTLFDFIVIFL